MLHHSYMITFKFLNNLTKKKIVLIAFLVIALIFILGNYNREVIKSYINEVVKSPSTSVHIINIAKVVIPLKNFILMRNADDKIALLMSSGSCVFCDISQANFKGIDIEGVDLRYANLSGADLSNTNLSGANLTKVNLQDTILIEADLTNADLKGADLRGANLDYANLSGVNLTGTNVFETNFMGASLTGVDLRNLDLTGANLSRIDFSNKDLTKTILTKATLSESIFFKANLQDTILIEAQLTLADLKDADLRGANLTGANLFRVDLRNLDLTRVNLSGVDLSNQNLTGTILSKANLSGVNATKAVLQGAILIESDLTMADLKYADLGGINFTGSDLTGSNLFKSNLRKANLTDINLTGANLTKANLSEATLDGVDLRNKDLTGVNLSGVDLSNQDLTGTILYLVNLSEAKLDGVDLRNKDLTAVNLSGVDLSNQDLTGATLLHADLSGVNLDGVDLSNKNLTGVNLTGVDLSNQDLTGTFLTYTNLSGANLDGVDLRNKDLTGTNLSGVDLSNQDLTGTTLKDAKKIEISIKNPSNSNWSALNEYQNLNTTRYDLHGDVQYIATKEGFLFESKNNTSRLVLDLSKDSLFPFSSIGEGGFLSVASREKLVYVSYISKDISGAVSLVVDEYSMNFNKVRNIITIDMSMPNDKFDNIFGGTLLFDNLGKLYLSTGDTDDMISAQDLESLKGKILRLDVSKLKQEPEIIAYGTRSPWGVIIDSKDRMFILQCGFTSVESLYLLDDLYSGIPANLGWPVFEGSMRRLDDPLKFNDILAPIFETSKRPGCLTAGVYLDDIETLLFADFYGAIRLLKETKDGSWYVFHESKIDQIIWGLGFDEKTKKIFIAPTNLELEISVDQVKLNQ
jgi:uncharacterized protein YjbI with pentapeptide repeats